MSRAGAFSSQGDYFQLVVATHWAISLLQLPEIREIQVESVGLPDKPQQIEIDDIVVVFVDGHLRLIQTKKNQPNFDSWSIFDLKKELLKARDQIEALQDVEIEFVSRNPFGELQKLAESALEPQLTQFLANASIVDKNAFRTLGTLLERGDEFCFRFIQKLRFGDALSLESWENRNLSDLKMIVSRADDALDSLQLLLVRHEAKVGPFRHTITKGDILESFKRKHVTLAPLKSESEILSIFKPLSAIGREWERDISGRTVPTPYVDQILQAIDSGEKAILVKGGPGSGKSCTLLDLIEAAEQNSQNGVLFVKSDWLLEADPAEGSEILQLPPNTVGLCSRLAESRRVIVVVDSLDVLSLSRHHRSLKLFLGLLDQLAEIPGVITVSACRQFDLLYDPFLRSRKWDRTIEIRPLDFVTQVAPLLESFSIEPSGIPPDTRELLTVPNLLRIFVTLRREGVDFSGSSPYEFYDVLIDELILKSSELGHQALEALYSLVEIQFQHRTLTIPKAAFPLPTAIARLCSLGVLSQSGPISLRFAHQSWMEALSVRRAVAKGVTLAQFIKAQKPLPFVRPSVRAFVLYLDSEGATILARSVRAVVGDPDIAYHLKRLVVESLADLFPRLDLWPLLRVLTHNPDLFRRLLWKIRKPEWFLILRNNWLPYVHGDAGEAANTELQLVFYSRFEVWMNQYPNEVIKLWRDALPNWIGDKRHLRWQIIHDLEKFEHWNSLGVRELFEQLLDEHAMGDRDLIGSALSRFVESANSHDDLLWRWIISDSEPQRVRWSAIDDHLHTDPHGFHTTSFLTDRLTKSGVLLDLALNWVEDSSKRMASEWEITGLFDAFLHSTSWERVHSSGSAHALHGAEFLFLSLEASIRQHSKSNSSWWLSKSSKLICSQEIALRYIYVLVAAENIPANISGISSILMDDELQSKHTLSYELGQLLHAASPYLSEEVLEEIQRKALSRLEQDAAENAGKTWPKLRFCAFTSWIPACFRLPETQEMLDRCASMSFPYRQPDIHLSGGFMAPPFSAEVLLELSDEGIFRILGFYQGSPDETFDVQMRFIGGLNEVLRVLQQAACEDPNRFEKLLVTFRSRDDTQSATAILAGLAEHVRRRTGHLAGATKDWKPRSAPNLRELCGVLIAHLERMPRSQIVSRDGVEILLACSEVAVEENRVAQLTALLAECIASSDPSEPSEVNAILHIGWNSVRGRAAEAGLRLFGRLVEAQLETPTKLEDLISAFAADQHVAVRAVIVSNLPYTLAKVPHCGWKWFELAFGGESYPLWEFAERCFYYTYRQQFDRVCPWLERMKHEASGKALGGWARILALAYLDQKLSGQQFFGELESCNSDEAWEEATHVFAANIATKNVADLCRRGLLYVFSRENFGQSCLNQAERMFQQDLGNTRIDHELAQSYLRAAAKLQGRLDFSEFLLWLENFSREEPIRALETAEVMAGVLEGGNKPPQIWKKDSLISAITAMLREADESDDPQLIHRVIELQDRLLRLNIYGMDEFYEAAAQP